MSRADGALSRPGIALRTRMGRAIGGDVAKALLAATLVAAAVVLLYIFAWLQPVGFAAYDALRVAWSGTAPPAPITLIGANEGDIARWGWPLRDEDLANLLDRMLEWHPRTIGVDIYRDRPVPPGSERLAALLAAHPEILWSFKLPEGGQPAIAAPAAVQGTDRAVLADTLVDSDGIVRRGLLFADDGQTNYAGMGAALAFAYLARDGIRLSPAADDTLRLGNAAIAPLDERNGPYVRLDNRGYQVLLGYRGGVQRFPVHSVAELMDGDALAEAVRDRIVLIGVAAESVKDWFATPFSTGFGAGPPVYGIAMHAHLADQLIGEAHSGSVGLRGLPRPGEAVLIWLVALAGAGIGLWLRYAVPAAIGIAVGFAAIVAATWFAFGHSLYLPGVPLLAAWVGSSGLTNRVLYAASNRERARLRRSFEHYLPPAVISDMLASRSLPKVGGERREISVVFTDIEGFTSLSERLDPEELAALLNRYFTGACAAIFDQGGLVYEFIGDAILAFFGAPHDQPDHADRAVDAALAIDAFAVRFCAEQEASGVPFGITRIGVHTGTALVGNIGTPARLKYTALGDMLNTGSRLEGLNKVIGTRICVSGDTVQQSRRHSFRPIADFVVKGRQGSVAVFDPVTQAPGRAPDAAYQAAFDALASGDPATADLFAALHRDYPHDPCVAFHYHRLRHGEDSTLIVMTEK
ncbi:MAG: adenylate/guanylate cyclase domain-containing protein [Alphaproteobacteria bacterium]|nr:adenylate/guanylate cyclase domain-containing protein [Alphaproteobacteria bacterium]